MKNSTSRKQHIFPQLTTASCGSESPGAGSLQYVSENSILMASTYKWISREEHRRAQRHTQVKNLRQRYREALWFTTSEIHDRNGISTEHWCGQYKIIGRIKKREIFTSISFLSHPLYWGALWDVKGAFQRLAADFQLSYTILAVDGNDRGYNAEEINRTKWFILPYWLVDVIRAVNVSISADIEHLIVHFPYFYI